MTWQQWMFAPSKVDYLPDEAMIGDLVEWEGTVFLWVGSQWQKLWDVKEVPSQEEDE